MILVAELKGDETAAFGEIVVRSKTCPQAALARRLLAAGHHPEARIEFRRRDTVCFRPAPLRTWADIAVEESNRGGLCFRKFKPMPAKRPAHRPAPGEIAQAELDRQEDTPIFEPA